MPSACTTGGLLATNSSECLRLTATNAVYAASSSLASLSTTSTNSVWDQTQATSRQATELLLQRVDDVRGYSAGWFQNSLHALTTFACDATLSAADKERCVPRGHAAAVMNGSQCLVVAGAGNCADQGLCERAANCYWPPPTADREPYFAASDIAAAKAWVTTGYPESLVPYAIPGVFLATLVLLATVVFFILRCGCNRCYGRKPHRHGYSRAERVRPIAVFALFSLGIALCAGFAFLQNDVITHGIHGAFDAVDMTLTNLNTMADNINAPLEAVSATLQATVADIEQRYVATPDVELNPATTTQWMEGNMTTVDTLRRQFAASLAALGPFPLGCDRATAEVLPNCASSSRQRWPPPCKRSQRARARSKRKRVQSTLAANATRSQASIEASLASAATLLHSVQAKAAALQMSVRVAYHAFSSVSFAQVSALMAGFAAGVVVCVMGMPHTVARYRSFASLALRRASLRERAAFCGCCMLRGTSDLAGARQTSFGAFICVVGFVISAAILVVAIVGNDSCHYVRVFHDDTPAVWPGQTADVLHACFHGTSLLKALDVEADLAFSCSLQAEFSVANNVSLAPLVAQMAALGRTLQAVNETTWFAHSTADLVVAASAYTAQLTLANLPTPWEAFGYPTLLASGEATCYFEPAVNAPRCYMAKACHGAATPCYTTFVAAYDTYVGENQLRSALQELNVRRASGPTRIMGGGDFSATTGAHTAGWNTSIVSIRNYTADFVDALTALTGDVLGPLQSGRVGAILDGVDRMKCSMRCDWLNPGYDLLYGSVCADLVGATLTVALCVFLMCVFLVPIIVAAIILEKRLRGLRKPC
ncbi:hypothetical protein ACHHYP_16054 [Achlya hypogyna]|uniref:Transmembrane protein n=1 Tax=Achlya hypogyna TaxID=1202772 RepID=A0A1V9Y9N8_ACHHY|nr:hypothetical protein ACHHYP_16054 [Achlya hypogyna]